MVFCEDAMHSRNLFFSLIFLLKNALKEQYMYAALMRIIYEFCIKREFFMCITVSSSRYFRNFFYKNGTMGLNIDILK